jgi:Ca-activated chloride channel family protein
MVSEQVIQIAAWAALGALALGLLGEWLQARRVRRIARLVFGPSGRAAVWTLAAPAMRVLALTGIAWSLVILLHFDGASRLHDRQAPATRHLMVLLDVSPSMEIKDAGAEGGQSRRDRAAAVLRSVMERANSDSIRITMACFYTDALQLVKECTDRELIWNFADNLPLHMAFKQGKTSLGNSLNTTGAMIKDFPRKSTTVVVLTDGDAVPATGLKPMPSAVANLLVVGVGNPARGQFLDGHSSRQDSAALSQVARRLGGAYFDANHKQVPSSLLRTLTDGDGASGRIRLDLRLAAVGVLGVSVFVLCLLPLLLEYFGSGWKKPVAGIGKEILT